MWPQQVVTSEPLVKNGCIARIRVTWTLWIVRPLAPSRMSPILAAPLSPKWKTRIGESHVLQFFVIVVSGFIIHENTREFTKRQRRVRSGGRLGDLVEMGVSHCKEAMVSTRMRRWISPRSRLAAEAVPESAGFGRPRCAMAVLPSSVS